MGFRVVYLERLSWNKEWIILLNQNFKQMKALLILTLFLSFQTLAQDDPTLFFGNSQSGEAISRSTKVLSIRSQSSGQVLSNYTIVSFTM